MTWSLYDSSPVTIGASAFASAPSATLIVDAGPFSLFQAFSAVPAPWAETEQWWGPWVGWTRRQDSSTVLDGVGITATGLLHGPFGAAAITLGDAALVAADITPSPADATSGKRLPVTADQWYRFAPGLGTPYLLYLMQGLVAGGQATREEIRGASAVATSLTASATLAGWSRKSLAAPEAGASSFALPAASLPDIASESILLMILYQADTAPGSNDESLVTIGGATNGVTLLLDHASVDTQQMLRMAGNFGGGAAGSAVLDDNLPHVRFLRINSTAGTVDYFSELEKFSVAFTRPTAGNASVVVGFNGADVSAAVRSAYVAVWRGTAAEVADATIAEAIQAVGYAISSWTWAAHGATNVLLGDGGPGGTPASVSAAGTVSGGTGPISGALAVALDAATSTAAGTVAVRGATAIALDVALAIATGIGRIHGTAAIALDAASAIATGAVPGHGVAAVTLDAASMTATGGAGGISGSASITLDDASATAAGTAQVRGAAAVALDDVTASATGGAGADHGAAAITLDDASASAAGTAQVRGAAAIALDDAVSTATGTVLAQGTAAITTGDATAAAVGSVPAQGVGDNTLDDAVASGTGAAIVRGSADVALDDAAIDASGTVTTATLVEGQLDVVLGDVDADAAGAVLVQGSAAVALDDAAISAGGADSATRTGEAAIALDDAGVIATATARVLERSSSGGILDERLRPRAVEPGVVAVPVIQVGQRFRVVGTLVVLGRAVDPATVAAQVITSEGVEIRGPRDVRRLGVGQYAIDVRPEVAGAMVVNFVGQGPNVLVSETFDVEPEDYGDAAAQLARAIDESLQVPSRVVPHADAAQALHRARMVRELRAGGVDVEDWRSDAYVGAAHGHMLRSRDGARARTAWKGN